MFNFEFLIGEAVRLRRDHHPDLAQIATEIGLLYRDPALEKEISRAVLDPFFPLTLFKKHHLSNSKQEGEKIIDSAGRALWALSSMFLRIRKDIGLFFGNSRVTCVDLNDGAPHDIPLDQWCSLCGECCQLGGTIPDPPSPIRYPGYWYSYISGDGPMIQRFCPFLFELPSQGIFFCSIHNIKPLTCLAYEKKDCMRNHPGKANK